MIKLRQRHRLIPKIIRLFCNLCSYSLSPPVLIHNSGLLQIIVICWHCWVLTELNEIFTVGCHKTLIFGDKIVCRWMRVGLLFRTRASKTGTPH